MFLRMAFLLKLHVKKSNTSQLVAWRSQISFWRLDTYLQREACLPLCKEWIHSQFRTPECDLCCWFCRFASDCSRPCFKEILTRKSRCVIYHCDRAGVHHDRLGRVEIDGRLHITRTEVWIIGSPCRLDGKSEDIILSKIYCLPGHWTQHSPRMLAYPRSQRRRIVKQQGSAQRDLRGAGQGRRGRGRAWQAPVIEWETRKAGAEKPPAQSSKWSWKPIPILHYNFRIVHCYVAIITKCNKIPAYL